MSAPSDPLWPSQGDETPRPRGITPDGTYCASCGHDADRHRRGRCWTDWEGKPVTRARTHIDCHCEGTTDGR